jgi:hypothetical protein
VQTPSATEAEPQTAAVTTTSDAADTATPAATEAPTATETLPENLIRLGDLEFIPFAPPWFEGDLTAVVFADEDKLRIDAPGSPFEPGDQEGLLKSLVFGAVTLEDQANFDISVTFNRQGGDCTGHDKCANLAAMACIVFGYFDPENFQIFCINEDSGFWTLDSFIDGINSSTSNLQSTDSIQPLGIPIFQYALHPEPNEFRIMMQDSILTGFINGNQVFERQGFLPQSCQNLNGVLACSPSQAAEPCNYAYIEGRAEQTLSGCSDLVGKIGVACFYNLPASIAAENAAQFGFGVGWDVSNCEVEISL